LELLHLVPHGASSLILGPAVGHWQRRACVAV
jgi:hypothetical protein